MPAAAVIPARRASVNVAALETLVVESLAIAYGHFYCGTVGKCLFVSIRR